MTSFSSALARCAVAPGFELRGAVVTVVAVVGGCGVEPGGDEELGGLRGVHGEVGRQREAAGRDADDAARDAVELDRAAEDVGIAAVAVLPEPVSENDDGRRRRRDPLRA